MILPKQYLQLEYEIVQPGTLTAIGSIDTWRGRMQNKKSVDIKQLLHKIKFENNVQLNALKLHKLRENQCTNAFSE